MYLDHKIIQPRSIFGVTPRSLPNSIIWMDLTPTVIDGNAQSEQVKKTWRDYQLALKMTSYDALGKASNDRDLFNDNF